MTAKWSPSGTTTRFCNTPSAAMLAIRASWVSRLALAIRTLCRLATSRSSVIISIDIIGSSHLDLVFGSPQPPFLWGREAPNRSRYEHPQPSVAAPGRGNHPPCRERAAIRMRTSERWGMPGASQNGCQANPSPRGIKQVAGACARHGRCLIDVLRPREHSAQTMVVRVK